MAPAPSRTNQPRSSKQAKPSLHTPCVGVVGLGYVGLPLTRAFVRAGLHVVGFDTDPSKIEKLRKGRTYLQHLGRSLARELIDTRRFTPTHDPQDLSACDAICICVPTPLGTHQEPDLSYVESSTRMIAGVLASRPRTPQRPPVLISLESTTYPGTTRDVCLPIFRRAGLRLGKDFLLCFSPEREDPGREGIATHSIPRLVGGIDHASTLAGVALYKRAVERVIPVASAEVAEAAKLLENIYRAVNIALVNELKPVLADMGIDIWNVIDAAATKPFGFQRFEPGPGLGGHCIPIDPYYLTWKAREVGHITRFIELAGEVNHKMPEYVVQRTQAALNDAGKPLRGARVLVLGIAYKPDVDDIRETPAAPIIELLRDRGAIVDYHDPHVPVFPSMRKHRIDLASVALAPATLRRADAVLILTHHKSIKWQVVASHARLIIDTRNAIARFAKGKPRAKVVKA